MSVATAIATPAVVAASRTAAEHQITIPDTAVSARAYDILTTEFVGVPVSGDDLKAIRERAHQELLASARSASSGIATVHAAMQLMVAHS